jgi:hypothetical protein
MRFKCFFFEKYEIQKLTQSNCVNMIMVFEDETVIERYKNILQNVGYLTPSVIHSPQNANSTLSNDKRRKLLLWSEI